MRALRKVTGCSQLIVRIAPEYRPDHTNSHQAALGCAAILFAGWKLRARAATQVVSRGQNEGDKSDPFRAKMGRPTPISPFLAANWQSCLALSRVGLPRFWIKQQLVYFGIKFAIAG